MLEALLDCWGLFHRYKYADTLINQLQQHGIDIDTDALKPASDKIPLWIYSFKGSNETASPTDQHVHITRQSAQQLLAILQTKHIQIDIAQWRIQNPRTTAYNLEHIPYTNKQPSCWPCPDTSAYQFREHSSLETLYHQALPESRPILMQA